MKLAIFDFDGTLFPKDTLPFLLTKFYHLKRSKFFYYRIYLSFVPLFLRYKFGLGSRLTKEQMKVMAMIKFNKLFTGISERELNEYFSFCSKEIESLLNKSIVEEVKKTSSEGFHTVLLSGSYIYLLKNIGAHLEFDTVIGTLMPLKEGIFDHTQDIEVIIGDLKLKKIQEHYTGEPIDWEESRAYADSSSDLDILQAVGHPVAVHPDAKLRAIAEERNWEIIS